MESTQQPQTAATATPTAPILETYHYSAASMPTTEDQLFELVQLSDIPMSKQLFDVIVELLRLNIPPSAILHVLKTLKAQATQTTMPPSLQPSRTSSQAHTPPLSTTHTSTTASAHGEASKPAHRKSDRSHATSASKQSTTQQSVETDKVSRKHRPGSTSRSKTSEKQPKSSVKGGSSSGSRVRGQGQDPSKKID